MGRSREEQRAYAKIYYADPERRARERRLRSEDPRRSLVHHAKARAKKLDLDFDLLFEDILVPELCPLLRIPIFVSTTGHPCGNSPTLDRVDNSKGYIKSNVRVISHKANSLKREHTLETLERFIQYIKGEL